MDGHTTLKGEQTSLFVLLSRFRLTLTAMRTANIRLLFCGCKRNVIWQYLWGNVAQVYVDTSYFSYCSYSPTLKTSTCSLCGATARLGRSRYWSWKFVSSLIYVQYEVILIIRVNEMHYFSNLFDNVLYMFRTGPLSIIRSFSILCTRNRYCHVSSVGVQLALWGPFWPSQQTPTELAWQYLLRVHSTEILLMMDSIPVRNI
jgi:hypothetical protein